MKVKALLAIAAALALSACVVADDPYYDDYSRENSARDYDHYDHGPRYRDRDDRDYRDYRDDRRSRRNSRIDSKFNCENGLSVQVRSLSPDRIELRLGDNRAALAPDASLANAILPTQACSAKVRNGIRKATRPSSRLSIRTATKWTLPAGPVNNIALAA